MDAEFWSQRYDVGATKWDLGRSPAELQKFVSPLPQGLRILIPGCGRGYEIADLAALGHEVTAVDYAPGAIAAARQCIGGLADRIICGDFFRCDLPEHHFDLCYERTFLCSLPKDLRSGYGGRIASLLRQGAHLVGVFHYGEAENDDPPVPMTAADRKELLEPHFELVGDSPCASGLAVFSDHRERWQVWRRR